MKVHCVRATLAQTSDVHVQDIPMKLPAAGSFLSAAEYRKSSNKRPRRLFQQSTNTIPPAFSGVRTCESSSKS